MFDLAAIDTAIHALALKPPAIVRPVMEAGETLRSFEKRMDAKLEEGERELAVWLAEGILARDNMLKGIAEVRAHAEPADLIRALDRYIDAVERMLAVQAMETEKLEARFKKEFKRAKSIHSAYADVVQKVTDRALAFGEKESEERSQFALLLRTLKAELMPDQGEKVTFSDPKELEAFLRNAIAS